jgi:hypothetical protein
MSDPNVMNFRPMTEADRRQLPRRSEWEEYGELHLKLHPDPEAVVDRSIDELRAWWTSEEIRTIEEEKI